MVKRLAERISRARIDTGLTQIELAELSGVKQSTISKWEKGHIDLPKPKHLFRVCRVLKLDVGEIMEELQAAYAREGKGKSGNSEVRRGP